MAGASDIRDIMELSAPSDAPKPSKRTQPSAAVPRLTGISREIYALMGDRAPPIPIGDSMTKYKSKPKYQQRDWKPRKWEQRAFVNGARRDGLVLRHWKLSNPVANGEVVPLSGTTTANDVEGEGGVEALAGAEETGGMVVKTTADGQQITTRFSDEFPMEKFNVPVQVPKYSEEQYNTHLKSDTWTKEETDYLMELCRDHDLRWFIIADRWNFDPEEGRDDEEKTQANGDSMDVDGAGDNARSKNPKWPQPRTMEQLKSRYYVVAAAVLAITRPPNDMLPSEYALWEKMQKFDAATETQRKKLAEALFSRSEDEAMEEKLLLAELKRIVDSEDQFLSERKDVYARLESVPSTRREADINFQSSAALSALLQNLLAKEKRGKVIRAPDGTASAGAAQVPAPPERTQSWEKGAHPNQYTRRNTLTEDGDQPPQKKGQSAANIRKLTPAEETKYGVSHHDRLTSGISFRHERVQKLTQAKSQAQTLKLQSALTELEIPPRLVMPTEKVCREFERLIGQVNLLLDVRKLGEKVRSEVQVLEEARRIRLGIPKEANRNGDAMDANKKENGEQQKAENSAPAEANEDQPATNGQVQNEVTTSQPGLESKSQEEPTGEDEDEGKDDDADDSDQKEENEETDESEENEEMEESKVDLDDDNESEQGEDDDDDEDQQQVEEGDLEEEDEDEETRLNLNLDDDDEEGQEDENDAEGSPEVEESELAGDESGSEAEDVDAEDGEDGEDAEDDEEDEDGGDEQGDEDGEEPQVAQSDGDDDPEEAAGVDEKELSAPPSAATRLHKRSASVISEGSRAGSNRSVGGRKRRK